MRIAHLSDIHLGYRAYSKVNQFGQNQREADVMESFRDALKKTLRAEPDLVLITGDLFHTVRPSNTSLLNAYQALRQFQERRRGAPLVIIAGNHETPRSAESVCILALFKHLPGVSVVYSDIEVLDLTHLGVSVTCIPSRGVQEIERRLLAPDPTARVNLLLLHGILEGVTQFALENPISRSRIIRDEWDYIALGDYHLFTQVAPNAYYAGATEFTSPNLWEEAGKPKGFVLYDTDSRQAEFVEVCTRKVYDLTPIDARELTQAEINQAIQERAEKVNIRNAIVRQRIFNILPEQRSGIDGALIRELRAQALHYHLDMRLPRAWGASSQASDSSPDTAEARLTLADEWRLFAKDYPLPADMEREAFIETGARMLSEAGEE
ncbi:MAG: DNA repair exonuclease [Fimbriimonadales bacterium]|jgi:DNA repair exonuclease SbcCD nuclease subunit|nr:DNA repair exonuclease [Fimbriimonadales bacterium]GBC91022.1 Nuclease SbcCD subunit D [bacterium HR14]CUU36938.1 DNA repair exonuclease SbcCD nuclease subunit [Armatimonadetes bacterium GXS]